MPNHVQNVNTIRSGKLKLKNRLIAMTKKINYMIYSLIECYLFIQIIFIKLQLLFKMYLFLKHEIYKCILKNVL